MPELSIILPAKNEAANLQRLLPDLCAQFPKSEIIVVDDGSTDDTRDVCTHFPIRVVTHQYSMGNGAAIKSGARTATGSTLLFMDADGQHDPSDISRLIAAVEAGHDMAVGARARMSQASAGRAMANQLYNRLATWMVGHPVLDLTSGFRAVRADKFREFLHLLPNGFSYPTTITMAFFRAGYAVTYVPIRARAREGRSHIRPLQDGLRFLLIIFKVGTLYSPLKLFFPISVGFFLLGAGNYAYTFLTEHRFTNMSALLLITSILIFLMGLISEQVAGLIYARRDQP